MDSTTVFLSMVGLYVAVVCVMIPPIARRLHARRPGYSCALVSAVLLVLYAALFAQFEPSSRAWVYAATFLSTSLTVSLVQGLSLARGALVTAIVVFPYAVLAGGWAIYEAAVA
jgi:hypothetical protein